MENIQSPRMRAKEVCAVLQCSRDFLYKLNRRGALKKLNDGIRFTYWLRDEVMAYAVGGNNASDPTAINGMEA